MDRLKKFSQFIEEKSAGLTSKAKTTLMADYTGKKPNQPPKNGIYPDQPKNTGVNGVLPYGVNTKEMPVLMAEPDGGTPLGQEKTPGLTPQNSAPMGQAPAGRPQVLKASRKSMKEFVEGTKIMSDAEFVNFLMNESKKDHPSVSMVHDLHGEPFTPHPHEAISYICSLMHNPNMVTRLVSEAKRHGHLESLVQELMDHPEFYDEAVKMMGDNKDGKRVTDKFARTMFDHHSKFRKDAGLDESRSTFRGRLLNEKVNPSLVDRKSSPEEAGLPTPDDGSSPDLGNPMMNPDGVAAEPGSNPSVGDPGQMDADGNGVGEEMNSTGMGDMQGGLSPQQASIPGATAAPYNMVQSIKGSFPDQFGNFCADGNC